MIRSATSIGDELLKLVGERLRGCTREVDIVARMGGDEFAIIMTQMEQAADAATLSSVSATHVIRALPDRRPPDRHGCQHRHRRGADGCG